MGVLLDTLRTKCSEVGNTQKVGPVTTHQLSPGSIMADWDADLVNIDTLNSDEGTVMSEIDMAIETIVQTTEQSTDNRDSSIYLPDTSFTKSMPDKSGECRADFQNILVHDPSSKTLTGEEDVELAETDIDGFLSQVSQSDAGENPKTTCKSSHVKDMHASRETCVSPAFSKHFFWPSVSTGLKKKETKSKRKLLYAVSSAEWQKM